MYRYKNYDKEMAIDDYINKEKFISYIISYVLNNNPKFCDHIIIIIIVLGKSCIK